MAAGYVFVAQLWLLAVAALFLIALPYSAHGSVIKNNAATPRSHVDLSSKIEQRQDVSLCH